MIVTASGMKYKELREEWTAVKLVEAHNVLYTEWLLKTKPASVSFKGTEIRLNVARQDLQHVLLRMKSWQMKVLHKSWWLFLMLQKALLKQMK